MAATFDAETTKVLAQIALSMQQNGAALLALLDPTAPAQPKADPAPRQAPQPKAATKVTLLRAKNREAFIKAAAKDGVDLAHYSTKVIAVYCVENDYAPKGWAIGEGYRAIAANLQIV